MQEVCIYLGGKSTCLFVFTTGGVYFVGYFNVQIPDVMINTSSLNSIHCLPYLGKFLHQPLVLVRILSYE